MNLEEKKKNATAFNGMEYLGEPKKAVGLFSADQYIQDIPAMADGIKGFIEHFERMQREYPEKSIEFVRCIAEGDLVALHTLQTWPGNEAYIRMDFFRFDENGKILAHLDSVQ
ncbi:MAG: SnoaL-like domain-containing protein [Flavobacteriales bacterium]|nr:SnoaL-like domain-containing protein [Flavobacteriales bacterium]